MSQSSTGKVGGGVDMMSAVVKTDTDDKKKKAGGRNEDVGGRKPLLGTEMFAFACLRDQ